MNDESSWVGYEPPKASWSVCVGGGYKIMCIEGKQPNRFHRWMQKVFLGLKWEKMDD